MTPIYFPFTHMAAPVLDGLLACFDRIVVYRPCTGRIPDALAPGVDAGTVDVRVPFRGDEAALERTQNDFRQWAAAHQGTDISFFKLQGQGTPFHGETATSRIRSDIQRGLLSAEGGGTDPGPDPDLEARLFLQVAQEYDRQSWDVHQELEHLAGQERLLMDRIHGTTDHAADAPRPAGETPPDTGAYLTARRLKAWTRLFFRDLARPAGPIPGIFVTSSRSVLESVLDPFGGVETVFSVDGLPVDGRGDRGADPWRAELRVYLERLASAAGAETGTAPPGPSRGSPVPSRCSLTVYRIEGQSPDAVFARWWEGDPQHVRQPDNGAVRHTLVGLLQLSVRAPVAGPGDEHLYPED